MFDNLLFAREGATALVTLNRPQSLNALNTAMLVELRRALLEARADTVVRALVITGAGEKAFAAGADIRELAGMSPSAMQEHARHGQEVIGLVEQLGKPVIAAINGLALGGGCELAMACTLRMAADTAQLGQPEVNLGLIPGFGGTQRLARLVGQGRALDLLLTGRSIDASEAFRIGLIDRITPASTLLNEARSLARLLSGKPPLAVRGILEAVRCGADAPLASGQALEASMFGLVSASADMREGVSAFLEKRTPVFKGGVAAVELQGTANGAGCRFAIVVSRFNHEVTDGLLRGARRALADAGVADDDITTVWVPGAFELPVTARKLAESKRFDAIITLGCLIKGETMHFEYIAGASTQGIMDVATTTGVPVLFGVLTAMTDAQAIERASDGEGNKGREVAVAAVEMATLLRRLGQAAL